MPQSRLWVAYEASAEKWGKDWGVFEKSGVALYQGQSVRVKCFQGARSFATAADLTQVMPASRPPAARKEPAAKRWKADGAANQGFAQLSAAGGRSQRRGLPHLSRMGQSSRAGGRRL